MGAERKVHGHGREREEAHRLPRGRPRDRGSQRPDHDPVYKVTIIPRGRALGVTMFLPETDRYSTSKRRLESRIATLFGGRVAEEIVFARTTSPRVPRTISNGPPRSRGTWSRGGVCPTASARSPTRRTTARCSSARSVTRARAGRRQARRRDRRGSATRHRSTTTAARKDILERDMGRAAQDGRRADEVRDHRRASRSGTSWRGAIRAARGLGRS